MDFSEPAKPLEAKAADSVAARTTFFYDNGGRTLVVEEEEAHLLHKKFKQIGVSDGFVFHSAVAEARKIMKETNDLKQAQEIVRKGERDELEAARGHLQLPRNFSFTNNHNVPIDKEGNPLPPNRRT